jgi:hypothetical protein
MVQMGEGPLPYYLWCSISSGIRRCGRQKTTLGKCLEKDALLKSSLEELWSKHKRGRHREAPFSSYAPAGVGRPKSKSVRHAWLSRLFQEVNMTEWGYYETYTKR